MSPCLNSTSTVKRHTPHSQKWTTMERNRLNHFLRRIGYSLSLVAPVRPRCTSHPRSRSNPVSYQTTRGRRPSLGNKNNNNNKNHVREKKKTAIGHLLFETPLNTQTDNGGHATEHAVLGQLRNSGGGPRKGDASWVLNAVLVRPQKTLNYLSLSPWSTRAKISNVQPLHKQAVNASNAPT